MAEYIEREAAISGLDELERTSHHNSVLWPDHVEECRETLRSIPAADVRPVVRGEWEPIMIPCNDIGDQIQDQDEDFGPLFRCTKCRHAVIGRPNFCPNCGAVMRETGNEKA